MSDTNETEDLRSTATPEQMEEMRQRMLKYYKSQNPLLELQSTHERHLADIEESRCRRLTMSMRLANMMAEAQQAEKAQAAANAPKEDTQTENIKKLAKKLKTENNAEVGS